MNINEEEGSSKFWEWLRDKVRREAELEKEASQQLPLYIHIEKPQRELPLNEPNETPFDSSYDSSLGYEVDYDIDYYT